MDDFSPADESPSASNAELSGNDGIDAWVSELSRHDVPTINKTVVKISRITSSSEASSSELAKVVLRDPSITAKVLKVANSVSFNPNGAPINTISRAVVILGFDTVQGIAISIALIESITGKSATNDRLLHGITQSFHAAYQAEAIAREAGDPNPEDIYIAALLNRLGALAFWACGCELAKALDDGLNNYEGKNVEELEKEILGFSLKNLSLGLATSWNLGSVVTEAMKSPTGSNSRWEVVNLSHSLAVESEKDWDSKEVESIVKSISKKINQNSSKTKRFVRENAIEANRRINSIWPNKAGKANTVDPDLDEARATYVSDPELMAGGEDESAIAETQYFKPDPILQLSVLHELLQLSQQKKSDINLVFQMVLEGIQRGIGMDRALMAVFTPKRDFLKTLYVLEPEKTDLRKSFTVNIQHPDYELFRKMLANRDSIWISSNPTPSHYKPLINTRILSVFGCQDAFIAAAFVGDKPIGVLYADRHISNRSLDQECFNWFCLFVQQANACLLKLVGNGSGG